MAKENKLRIKIGNKEFSLSFILSTLSSISGMLFSFLAARFLQSELYGEIHYYISIITLLSALMVFGVDNYLIKTLQFSSNKKADMGRAYVFIVTISSLILPVYFRIASSFLTKLNNDSGIILIIFFIALALSLCSVTYSFFQAIDKYHFKILFGSFLPHVLFLLAFAVHFFTNSLDIFIQYYLLYYFIFYCLIGLPIILFLFKPFKNFYAASEIKTIVYMALAWILYNLTTPISSIIIGETYQNFSLVGIFSISNQLLSISAIATSIISNISLPVFAKFAKENNLDGLYNYYQSFVRITMYIAIPFYCAFIIEANNIMMFFGESYLGHNIVLILLTISSMIETITGPCGSVLLMANMEKQNFFASAAKFAIFIIATSVFIKFTPYAAPISSVISAVVCNAMKLFYASKHIKRNLFGFRILFPFLILVILSSGVFFGLSFITDKIIWVLANALSGISLIIAFIILTPFKQDKLFFTKGKNNLKKDKQNE